MAKHPNISRSIYLFFGVVLCLAVAASIWFIVEGLETKQPTLQWETPLGSFGRTFTLKGIAADPESGLQRIWIALMQEGKEVVLLDQEFPSEGLLRKGIVRRHPISLEIDASTLGFVDGAALLRTACWDYSYTGWLSGNRSYVEHGIVIDTKPPVVEMVTQIHNLNQGGAGLAIYRVAEPVVSTGVKVGEKSFPGVKGYFKDEDVFMAFFALPYDEGLETQLYVTATDEAGNVGRSGFAHHINTKSFKSDIINVSDGFLKQNMPKFEGVLGGVQQTSSIETFLKVNRDLRQTNYETIQGICGKSDASIYWNGAFLRLPASARRAGFADHRTYVYDGKTIDRQVHLGIDLASTSHSPVPAANSGRIAFAEDLGIYGRTVIVDHGFYLFSMYSHLSRIQVTPGQMVSKGDILGFTGTTGLAAGDHLHFSVLIHQTFVNPIEWWDATWIKNNISDKLKGAVERIGVDKKEASL